MSGAVAGARAEGSPVHVSTAGPFAVGSTLWRDGRGRLMCTVVAKATYELVPGDSAPLDAFQGLQEDDAFWDDDPTRSVAIPGDLSPFKRAAEVVVVGSAFATRPTASLVARVVVGNVDKSVEAFPPRHFRLDGTLEPSTPLPRFSLRYERAAGGPGTDNPPGIDVSRADARGRHPLPQLMPPFHAPGHPGAHVPTAGFGPIAPGWPSRSSLLSPGDRAWAQHPTGSALPPSFPAGYFQSAPSDQWLDRPLAANERIVLEGLHPDVGRLAMSLSGLEPRAIVADGTPESVRLAGDLLFVDTERGLCTLTYRGTFPVDEGAGPLRVVVVGVRAGAELGADEMRRLVEHEGEDVETTHVEALDLPHLGATDRFPVWTPRPVLPFGGPAQNAPHHSAPDGGLPFFRAGEAAPARPVEIVAPPSFERPAPPPQASVPVPAPAPIAPPSLLATPELPRPLIQPVPPPAPIAVSTLPAISAHPEPPARFGTGEPPAPLARPAAPARRPGLGPAGFDSAFGGARAASDAAADRPAPPPERSARPSGASQPAAVTPGRRQAVVSLLSFEPSILPRLRDGKRFAAALGPRTRTKRPQGVDEPLKEAPPDDRADVLRVLSCGQPADAAEIHRALTECLDEVDDLDPPLLLVAGELRPTFDEVEVLRATVAVTQAVAGGDKKVLAALAVGQEALAAPVAPRTETTLGLVRQIEQAAGSLSLPARYVPTEVERVVVEGRKYKRRTLLGAPRLRADLVLARGGEVMPLYLPESTATSLPLLPSFQVVVLCEITPREDLTEAQDEALVAVALGRVLRSR